MSEEFIVDIWMKGFDMIVYYFWEVCYIIDCNGVYFSIIKGNFGFIC